MCVWLYLCMCMYICVYGLFRLAPRRLQKRIDEPSQ